MRLRRWMSDLSSGLVQDPATLLKNPAGMSLLDGNQFQGGLQVLQAGPGFTPGATTTVDGNSVGNAVGLAGSAQEAPVGHADQWIKTIPGKGWFTYFRIYGPEPAAFDRSWKPGDFEEIK